MDFYSFLDEEDDPPQPPQQPPPMIPTEDGPQHCSVQ